MAGTRPNDLPCMYVGETRLVTFDYKGGAGDNTLNAATFVCVPSGGITFADENADELEATARLTAVQSGCFTVICTGTLTSDEVIKLTARVKVSDPTVSSDNRDYD
jgi:hypothetical protein